ncbi:MAG: carboxypeptidase-like regulatory domain-containing protein, partial [Acidobacteriota bacterium]
MKLLLRRAALSILFAVAMTPAARAGEIASADLQIAGAGLRVVTVSATTGLDIPVAIQTEFGGKQNDDATVIDGLLAVAELSGPGIDTPIRLETAPGHKFQIPGLSREGVYFLQNIRLTKSGDFLQPATPSVATITVSNLLQTSVRVKQLTPEELRARGISVDPRNFDVYEYTFSFIVNGQTVEIPFPVMIDKRTHEVRELPKEDPYRLPEVGTVTPPRWEPPEMMTFDLVPPPSEEPNAVDDPSRRGAAVRPSIPAALVIPNSMAVLHQFFAVTLMVTNGAPAGSTVTLDGITGLIKPPAPLRTVKSIPSVAFNQPVPVVDAANGVTFLVAQAKGEAEWTMEGLQPGTHTIEVEVRATYKSPGQADFPLKGTARASIVVHDPRFNVNFSHPDTVRKDIEYSTYSFITNMSGAMQSLTVTNGLPACADSPGANVCRVDGTPASHDLTIPAGEMRSIEYKLKAGITGHVFATAGSVSDSAVSATVQLNMGVSESGIPLSPATLIMPYYAKFLSQPMVSGSMQLLGLGYSLATAPLTAALASHPHVIKTDVFQRAVDIARAGQRVFLGESMQDSLIHMDLDLLGNSLELREWDDLRRQEKSGRTASAAIARELETSIAAASFNDYVSHAASITAWRAPYLLALAHGATVTSVRPYAVSVRDVTSNAKMDVPSEAASGWIRQLPFGELNTLQSVDKSHSGELAVVGRWAGSYEVSVTPAADGAFALDVILPAATAGSVLRGHFDVTGTANKPLTLLVTRGATSLQLRDANGGVAAVGTITPVVPETLGVVGAHQDLNLDAGGHKVSVLWNRPVKVADGDDLLRKFAAQIALNRDGVNYSGPRPISSAALQDGGRVANVTFDHSLSQNATYSMTVAPLVDPLSGANVTFGSAVVPVIDNNAPGGIIYGHVLKGDNTPIGGADVQLLLNENAGPPQFDKSRSDDGSFLFEFVPRDIANNISGSYELQALTADKKSTSVNGAVRLPGRVHYVNLVFLGRGGAEGYVRYDNGEVVANASVVVGSTMFDQFRSTTTDALGHYTVTDLPVGPLTFSATDGPGNVTFAASEIKTPGQVLQQDLSIYRRPFPGTGSIRGVVKRSDTNAVVAGAHVGVYTQGYGLVDGFTDSQGRFAFSKVPSGFVTVLASEWTISRESIAVDFDLSANESRDVTLVLNVKPSEALASVEGDVVRENPLFPGDATHYQKVAAAIVRIDGAQAVTADANGHFVFQSLPVSFSGRKISGYDPSTTRSASSTLPQLDPSRTNIVPIFISTASGFGEGTVRVRLLDGAGYPVNDYRVIVPGFPPEGPTTLT